MAVVVCGERFGGGVCITSVQGASVVNSSAFNDVVFAGMEISCSNKYDRIGVLKWGDFLVLGKP